MDHWIEKIAEADEWEIEEALRAVLKRYDELHPDWVVSTMSVEKKRDQNEQLDAMIRTLESLKTSKKS